jgi:hypothetical protein
MQNLVKNIKSNLECFLLIFGIWFFNVLDGILTIKAIEQGAEELNPIMKYFLEIDHSLFLLVKITIVTACLSIFWKNKNNKITHFGIIFCFVIYLLLTFYHFYMINKYF